MPWQRTLAAPAPGRAPAAANEASGTSAMGGSARPAGQPSVSFDDRGQPIPPTTADGDPLVFVDTERPKWWHPWRLSLAVVAYEERRPQPTRTARLERTYAPSEETPAQLTMERRPVRIHRQRAVVALPNNRLVQLSPDIARLEGVRTLDLSHNRLVTLDPAIGQLKGLVHLCLSQNQLKELPETIGGLTDLTMLDLSYNQLTSLTETIGQLKRLTHLSVSHNHLKELPRGMGQLEALVLFRADHNELVALPAELARLRQLRTLSASQNRLLDWRQGRSLVWMEPAPAVPALQELAARKLLQHWWLHREDGAAALTDLPPPLREFMRSYRRCSHCNGPFFGAPVRRYRFTRRGGQILPFMFELCTPHWWSELERIQAIFAPPAPDISKAEEPRRNGLPSTLDRAVEAPRLLTRPAARPVRRRVSSSPAEPVAASVAEARPGATSTGASGAGISRRMKSILSNAEDQGSGGAVVAERRRDRSGWSVLDIPAISMI